MEGGRGELIVGGGGSGGARRKTRKVILVRSMRLSLRIRIVY